MTFAHTTTRPRNASRMIRHGKGVLRGTVVASVLAVPLSLHAGVIEASDAVVRSNESNEFTPRSLCITPTTADSAVSPLETLEKGSTGFDLSLPESLQNSQELKPFSAVEAVELLKPTTAPPQQTAMARSTNIPEPGTLLLLLMAYMTLHGNRLLRPTTAFD